MEKSMEDNNIFYFGELPLEVQEHILFHCDDNALTVTIPRVSTFINRIVTNDACIWRDKCREYYTDSDWDIIDQLKKLDETWKQFYLRSAYHYIIVVTERQNFLII